MTWEHPPEQLLYLSVDISGHQATVTLSGELDLSNTERVYEQFRVLVDAGVTELVCHVAALSFVDSTGLSVFLSAHNRLVEVGGKFVLRSPTPAVARLFEITGVHHHLIIEADPPNPE